VQLAERRVGGTAAVGDAGVGGGDVVVAHRAAEQLGVQRGVGEELHRPLEDVLHGAVVVDVDEVEELAHRLVLGGAGRVDGDVVEVGDPDEGAAQLAELGALLAEALDALVDAGHSLLEAGQLDAQRHALLEALGQLEGRPPDEPLEHRPARAVVRLEALLRFVAGGGGGGVGLGEALDDVVDLGGAAVDAVAEADNGGSRDANVEREGWRRDIRAHRFPS
jgi:hypothetical protein